MWRIKRSLNSNIESIFINVENCSISKRKTVLFWKIPNFTAILLPVHSIFKIFEKWFDIWVQFLNARFLKCHTTIYFFKIFFELKKQFWTPLTEGYLMPSEMEFSKKKVPHPTVQCTLYSVRQEWQIQGMNAVFFYSSRPKSTAVT